MIATRLLVVLTVAVLGTATAASGTGKEPRKAIRAAAQARAKHIAVGLRDLAGFGWHATPTRSDRSNARCSYYDPDQSLLTEHADYTSPDFTRSDGLYVSSTVRIFATGAQAKTSYGLVARPALARCLGESIAGSLKVHIVLRSTGPLPFPRRGDRSVAYRIEFLVDDMGQKVPATIDLVVIDKGAVDVALFFSSAGRLPPADLERRVSAAVAGRI
jgi:hypothetical protein